MASGWDQAYLRQAESDYEVFNHLVQQQVPDCHKLHYLQMATEQLAKSFLSSGAEGKRQPNVHEKLVGFMRATESHGAIARNLGFSSKRQYASFVKSIISVGQAIEDIYPKGGLDRPNPEYPWEINGTVTCPCDYAFQELKWTNPRVRKFRMFLDNCFRTAHLWSS